MNLQWETPVAQSEQSYVLYHCYYPSIRDFTQIPMYNERKFRWKLFEYLFGAGQTITTRMVCTLTWTNIQIIELNTSQVLAKCRSKTRCRCGFLSPSRTWDIFGLVERTWVEIVNLLHKSTTHRHLVQHVDIITREVQSSFMFDKTLNNYARGTYGIGYILTGTIGTYFYETSNIFFYFQ